MPYWTLMQITKTNRKKTRKFLFQKLYTRTFWEFDEKKFKEYFFSEIFSFSLDEEYLDEMYDLVIKNESYLIGIIMKYAPRFDVKSMNYSILLPVFIWLTEMLFLKEEIPAKVSINEAIELSKTYGDDSSKKIVNWILNNFYENMEECKKIKDELSGKVKFKLFK